MFSESADLQYVIDKTVHERLNALSLMRFYQLVQLPSLHSEDIIWEEKKFVLSVWHDMLPSKEHRIVVQAYKPGILGIGQMQADGFAINDQDEKRPLTVEEWAPFS
jgi:hypothetical protein